MGAWNRGCRGGSAELRRWWRLAHAFVALAAFTLGCTAATAGNADGDASPSTPPGDAVPGNELTTATGVTSSYASLPAPTWFYRLDLTRDAAGNVAIGDVTAVDALVRPMPGLAGEYWAVASAGSTPTSVAPFVFPRDGHDSSVADDGSILHTDFSLTATATSVFIEATGVDNIAITAADGTTILELPNTSLPPLGAAERVYGGDNVATASEGLSVPTLHARYPHIKFLTAGEEAKLPVDPETGQPNKQFLGSGKLVAPSDAMNDVIAAGLAELTPAVLAAVEMVGVAQWPAGSAEKSGLWGRSTGPALVLNADRIVNTDQTANQVMVRAIVHEAAHSFTFLEEAHQEWVPQNENPDAWTNKDTQKAAAALVARYRLSQGLLNVWKQLHETGVAAKLSLDYLGDAYQSIASEEAARAFGFATRIGSQSPLEDFAEFAATASVPPAGFGACQNFSGLSSVDASIAVPYGKLVLLTSLGVVSAADFSACVGSVEFQTKPGVDFGVISFTQNLHAGELEDGGPYYGVLGDGPASYETLIKLPLPSMGASPLGIHRLDSGWVLQVDNPGRNEILVGNDNTQLSRASAYGLVLVTEASEVRTRGALIGVAFGNGFGELTDFVPFGTFQVP